MRFKYGDTGIEYEIHGRRTGIPVVLIHGFPFSKEMWRPQIDALKDHYYAVTYDVRGHGGSDTGDGQYSVEYFVDDLIALLDHLRISRAVTAGLSMGGYIALRAIERHPDRFRGLVLADTRSEPDGNDGRVKRASQARSIKTEGMEKFTETFLGAVFFEKTFRNNPDAVERIRKIILGTNPLAASGTLLALAARTDTTPSLYNISVPTLILVGQHDTITPPSAAQAIKSKIPGSEIHIIPNAAHLSNIENPEEFNGHLLNFLGKIK